MIFAQPLFLLGLLSISIPIIIHLWFRKKLERIPFSTLTFLKTSEARRFGWLKFRQIAILILRCLFIAAIFLSLARPHTPHPFFGARRLASIILIIDNSYSMAYDGNFQKARTTAHEILNRYSPKSECIVVPLCTARTDGPAMKKTWLNIRSGHNHLDNISLSYQSGNIQNLLTHLATEEARNKIEYVYIGDGQERVFAGFTNAIEREPSIYWFNTKIGSNINIQRVTVQDPISISLEHYRLDVQIFNYSTLPWTGRAVVRAGDLLMEETCELQPMHDGTVTFTMPAAATRGTITLYEDSLRSDNVYFFSKSIPQQKDVLIIGNDTYLRPGLQPVDDAKMPFRVSSTNTLAGVDLRRFHTIIFNGIAEITVNDRSRLLDFMKQPGRSVLVMLGDHVGENLRAFLDFCCTIESPGEQQGYVTVDWIEVTHPALEVFVHSNALRNVRVFHFQHIIATAGVVAKLTGDHPFIVIRDNLAVLATQCTPGATDIIYSTSFIPLLYRLINSTSGPRDRREFQIGESIPVNGAIRSPQGEYLKPGDVFLVPGFYDAAGETIAVNVLPEEGNVKTIGETSAQAFDIRTISLEDDMADGSLAQILLYGALAFLFLEILLLVFA